MKFLAVLPLVFAVALSKPTRIQAPKLSDLDVFSESELKNYKEAPVSIVEDNFSEKIKLCDVTSSKKSKTIEEPLLKDDFLDGDVPAPDCIEPAHMEKIGIEKIDLDLFDAQEYADVLDSEAEFSRSGRDYEPEEAYS